MTTMFGRSAARSGGAYDAIRTGTRTSLDYTGCSPPSSSFDPGAERFVPLHAIRPVPPQDARDRRWRRRGSSRPDDMHEDTKRAVDGIGPARFEAIAHATRACVRSTMDRKRRALDSSSRPYAEPERYVGGQGDSIAWTSS